jgi:uncharacterized protein (TIGR02996 family)
MTELEGLLASWRKNRAPDLADEIDRVSAELTAKEKPIKGKADWWPAYEAYRPEVLERLLDNAPSGKDRVERIAAICKLPADPRMGSWARKWLEHPPVVATSRKEFFGAVVKLLEHVRDVRLLPVLSTLLSDRSSAMQKCGLINYKPLQAHAEKLAKERPKAATVAKRASAKKADVAALLAQVYANPADDAVRAVLADALVEQGDPRGEFINLQLAGKSTAQEKKLASTWGRAWLGAIEPVLLKDGVEFARGFPSKVRYAGGAKADVSKAAEWSTIEHLDVEKAYKDGPALLVSPALKSLRHAVGLRERDLDAITKTLPKLPWETLGFYVHGFEYLSQTIRKHKKALGGVKKLVSENADSSPWEVTPAEVTKLLGHLPAVEAVDLELKTNIPQLIRENPRLTRIRIHEAGHNMTFEPKAKLLGIEIVHGWVDERDLGALIKELAPVKIVISTTKKSKIVDGTLQIPKYGPMSLGPIEKAAKKSELVFELG